MSRLTIDITDSQHKSLKALAALQGKTIKQYALERLFPTGAGDAQAWDDLRALLNERIAQGLSGKVSSQTIDEILEEELGAGSRA